MRIQLSDHFTTGKLLRFVAPSIVMMIFTSVYGVVDGLFVSNFVGKTAFAAVNLIFPLLMILGALGFMIGTGGSALVARTLGEGDSGRAQRYFSMLVYVTIGGGIVFSVLQNVFQSFLITAEKPHFGLGVTVAAGLTNIILDFLFIAVFRWGVAGAAIATAASQFVGGGVPLLYFARPNRSLLRLGKTKLDSRALLKACTNGSSELMTNLSSSLVTVLYNFQLMQLAGEDGIAAYGVIMYVNFIFIAIFIGYSIGSAPVVGYHHGAGNSTELKSLFRKSLLLVGAAGVALTAAAEALALPLTKIFVGYDAALLAMTCRGFRLYSLSFLLTGFNIFSSGFFTALNDGFVSAVISFLRTLVFQTAVVLVLPALMGTDGIWLAIVVAELLALAVSAWFLWRKRGKYRYA